MSSDYISVTLPLTQQGLNVIVVALFIAILTGVIWLALSDRENERPDPARRALEAFGWVYMPIWLIIFAATLWSLWQVFPGVGSPVAQDGFRSLGLGALIAALLGAPFVIWGTVLKHQTVMFQKEGHMTDRINKAVEQLGAEKEVRRLGRNISIRTKRPEGYEEIERLFVFKGDEFSYVDGDDVSVEPWEEVTLSAPNIEVRIGAILSLERIAQDSTRHDKGRDHVRVMEILCAYIRENSNATPPIDHDFGVWESLKMNATEEERAAHIEKRDERFSKYGRGNVWDWAQNLPEPRADIALALKVLGRRTAEQRKVEAAWPDPSTKDTIWPFDLPCPILPKDSDERALTSDELDGFKKNLDAWMEKIKDYSGYQLDLRGANLQRADMSAMRPDQSDAVFSGVLFERSKMQGVNLSLARLEGANFIGASLEAAHMFRVTATGMSGFGVNFESANLFEAELNGAWLRGAKLNGAAPHIAQLCFANLIAARFECADLYGAQLQGALVQQADFRGADLDRARMAATFVNRVKFDDQTSLELADFSNCGFKHVDFSYSCISIDQIFSAFGDGSVLLPDGVDRPKHWPEQSFRLYGDDDFTTQWRKWQEKPDSYKPPAKTHP